MGSRSNMGLGLMIQAHDAFTPVFRKAGQSIERTHRHASKVMREAARVHARQAAQVARTLRQQQREHERAFRATERAARATQRELERTRRAAERAEQAARRHAATAARQAAARSRRARAGQTRDHMFAGGMITGVGALAVAGLSAAGNEAGKFEQGMARVAAISDIATDSTEALMLETTALGAAMKTKFSPEQATEGLQQFAGAGFDAQAQADALVPALRLAQAGMISVGDSARSMTSAIKVFGIETEDAGLVTDKLLKIANLTDLQANDLALALGTVGRGAGLARQNLDEILISMGLVKNTGVQASVAASSVSSALIFMGQNAQKFQDRLGVSVTDANGKFRPFIDVVMDTHAALGTVTDEAERTAIAQKLFGKFGVAAFQAVSNQITNGVKTSTGQLLTGAAAVEYLRTQLADAAGTAAEFEEKMLGTFEGQKQLLQGLGQSLLVVLGKPFVAMMKDVLKVLLPVVEKVVLFVDALPPGVKKAILGVAFGVAALVTALGGLAAVVGAVRFAGPMLLSSLGPLLPWLAGIAAAALVVVGAFKLFKYAADKNLGGFGDTVGRIWDKVKLFFQGLKQLFTDGQLSGDVLSKLLGEDMQGVRKALGFIVRVGARIKAFFGGIADGFTAFIDASAPAFAAFKDTLENASEALGEVFGGFGDAKNPIQTFADIGKIVGGVLGKVVVWLMNAAGIAIRIWTGLMRGAKAAYSFIEPFVDFLVTSFESLFDAIGQLLTALGIVDSKGLENTATWETFGKVLGFIGTMVLLPIVQGITFMTRVVTSAIRVLARIVTWLKSLWSAAKDFGRGFKLMFKDGDTLGALRAFASGFRKIFDGLVEFFKGNLEDIQKAIGEALDFLADVAAKIPDRFRPEFLDEFIASRQASGGAPIGLAAASSAVRAQGNATQTADRASRLAVEASKTRSSTAEGSAQAELLRKLERLAEILGGQSAGGGGGKGSGDVNVTAKLIMDGRELAAKLEAAKAREDAIAFSS